MTSEPCGCAVREEGESVVFECWAWWEGLDVCVCVCMCERERERGGGTLVLGPWPCCSSNNY